MSQGQGIYKRTKSHREGFTRNMHSPEANRKRQDTMRRNRELAENHLVEKEEKLVEKEKKPMEKIIVDKDKSDYADKRLNNLDKEELGDRLASIRQKILDKVKDLSKNLKSLQMMQDERDKIENRLAELGMRFQDQ